MTIQQHASFDSSAAELNATSKLVKAWESKNARNAAKAGGISMMALSLAACGGSSTTTTATDSTSTDTTTTVTAVSSNFTTAIDALSGTSAADTFTGDAATVSGADSVAGGAGIDTLKVYGIAASSLPAMSGVENLEVYNIANAGSFDLTAAAFADVTKLTLDNTTATAANTITLEADDTLALKTVTGAADVNIATAATITTTSVEINGGVGASTDLMELDFNGTGLTSISLATTGANYVDIDSTGATAAVTLTVTGDGTGTLDVDDDQTTIDASATTGGMTIQGDFAGDVKITAGSGDDKIIAAGEVSASDVIDGGSGEDTLSVTADFSAATGTISNIEVVELADTADSQTIDVDDAFAGITKFVVSGNDSSAQGVYSINDAATGSTITLANIDPDVTDVDDVTVDLKTDSTADALTFNVGTATVATSFDALTADDAETVTLVAGSKDGHSIANLDLTDATAVTMSGAGNATIAGINLKDAANSFDASAATGDLTLTFEDDQNQTIKTGSGKDSISLDADTVDSYDSISMGDGTDTLNLTAGSAAIDVTFASSNDIEAFTYVRANGSTGASDSVKFDFREMSGLTAITIDGDQADLVSTVTLDKVASGATVTLKDIADASADTHTINAVASAAAMTVNLDGVDNATDDTVAINNVTAVTVGNATGSEASNLADLNTGAATSLSISAAAAALVLDDVSTATLTSLSVAGGFDVTISAGGATTIKTITAATLDAANNGAELVLGTGSSIFARATDAVITGSDGADTISMSVAASTHAANVIDAGNTATVGTSVKGDMLSLGGSMTGDTVIDLSSTTDQISSLSGVANAAVQKGFESVDASAASMVSTAKFTITGSDGINHITTDAGADIIDAGAGADVIDAGAGNDTITTGTGADTIVFGATATANGNDTISDFTAGSGGDVLNFDAFLGSSAAFMDGGSAVDGAIGATNEGAASNGTSISGKVITVDTDTIADVTAIKALIVDSSANNKLLLKTGQKAVILHGDANGTGTGDYSVYYVTAITAENTETVELAGTLSSVDLDALVAANLF